MELLQIMIGHALRRHRHARGLTLREAADAAHMSYSYLSEAERGKKPISSDAIWSLSVALGVPLSALLAEVAELVLDEERRADARLVAYA